MSASLGARSLTSYQVMQGSTWRRRATPSDAPLQGVDEEIAVTYDRYDWLRYPADLEDPRPMPDLVRKGADIDQEEDL